MRKKMLRSNTYLVIIAALAVIIMITGCNAGISKEDRLEAFILDMESGPTPNPREHFSGHSNAWKIDSDTFNTTNMAPNNNLDITGYVITGDTFTMDFTTDAFPGGLSVTTASFHMEKNNLGGEEWFIYSMTVPAALAPKIIPDEL